MIEIETKTRNWGNSIGVVIPKEIAEKEHIKSNEPIKLLLIRQSNALAETFGKLKKWRKPTDEIMAEIDKGYNE